MGSALLMVPWPANGRLGVRVRLSGPFTGYPNLQTLTVTGPAAIVLAHAVQVRAGGDPQGLPRRAEVIGWERQLSVTHSLVLVAAAWLLGTAAVIAIVGMPGDGWSDVLSGLVGGAYVGCAAGAVHDVLTARPLDACQRRAGGGGW